MGDRVGCVDEGIRLVVWKGRKTEAYIPIFDGARFQRQMNNESWIESEISGIVWVTTSQTGTSRVAHGEVHNLRIDNSLLFWIRGKCLRVLHTTTRTY